MANDHDYTVLGSTAERYYIWLMAFFNPIASLVSIVILRSLIAERKEMKKSNSSNPFVKTTLKLAILHISISICLFIDQSLFTNDLFFDLNIENPLVSSITLVITMVLYFSAKMVLYYALTYYHESVAYESDNSYKTSKFVIFWMVFAGIGWTILGVIYTIDDMFEHASKEIAVTKNRHIHFTVLMGHEDAPYGAFSFVVVIIFDFIYFAVLIALFVSDVRKMNGNEDINNNQRNAIIQKTLKALTLIAFTCVALWVNAVAIAFEMDIRWITSVIDLGSDCICIYLLIVDSAFYWIFFGVFHDCFGKCLYGSAYKRSSKNQSSDYDAIGVEESEPMQA